eukprot:gene40871-54310_t
MPRTAAAVVALPAAAFGYRMPPFSWDTLPVQTLARYAMVTLEKYQGTAAFHWAGLFIHHGGCETCQKGSDASACGCCEEDTLKVNSSVMTIAYTNGVIAYP